MKHDQGFEEFQEDLKRRKKSNMHFFFFQNNFAVSSIKIPILNKHDKYIQLNPYRNIQCVKPSCVYDYSELLQLYQSSKSKQNLNLVCQICQTLINLATFFCDETLKSLIIKIWEKYNKTNKIICHEVKIFRNGDCIPIIAEYLKLMEKNYVDNFINRNEQKEEISQFKVPPFLQNNDGALKFTVKYGKFPKISDFSQQESEKLQAELLENFDMNMQEVILERYGNILLMNDYQNFISDTAFPISLMTIYLMYMQELQKNDDYFFNYEKANRGLFLGYNLKKFDNFHKIADYEIFFGMKNYYIRKTSLIYSNFDLIFIVIIMEERYFLCVVYLKKNVILVINFLDPDLETIQNEDFFEITVIICEKELGLKKLKHKLYERKKINKFSDFGLFVGYFIFKVLKEPLMDEIRMKTNEKDLFKKFLTWLILKLSKQKPQKVYFYDFKKNLEPEIQEYKPSKPQKPMIENKSNKRILPNVKEKEAASSSMFQSIENFSKISLDLGVGSNNWDFMDNQKKNLENLNDISRITVHKEKNVGNFFNIRNRKKEEVEEKELIPNSMKKNSTSESKKLILPRIQSVQKEKTNYYQGKTGYEEPKNKESNKYFGRNKDIEKEKEIFKEVVQDRSYLSGEDDELVLNKENLVSLLKDYKNKLREKQQQSLDEESNEEKEIDEDDIRIKEDKVNLTKKQLRQLLEKHEEFVKNDYYGNLQYEYDLMVKNQLAEMSQEEEEEERNSQNELKKKKKRKKKKKEKKEKKNQNK